MSFAAVDEHRFTSSCRKLRKAGAHLHAQLSEGVWVVSQAQGVKGLPGVHPVQALASWATVRPAQALL